MNDFEVLSFDGSKGPLVNESRSVGAFAMELFYYTMCWQRMTTPRRYYRNTPQPGGVHFSVRAGGVEGRAGRN